MKLTAKNDTELLRVRTPCEIMDGAFLVEWHTTVKVARGTDQIQTAGLSVVALVGLVYIGLCEDEDLRAERVPLDLRALCLEKRLLAGGRAGE